MRVKLTAQLTGTRDGVDWPAKGEELDVPDDEAADLIHAGIAEPVVEDKTEKATAPKAEQRKGGLTTKTGPTAGHEE